MVAHGGHPAIDGAGSDRDEYLAVLAELAQHMHIVCVAHPALDQAYVARIAMFDVGKRRAIELDMLQQGHQSFIHICLLYTSDAADDLLCVDLGGRRIIKKKTYT